MVIFFKQLCLDLKFLKSVGIKYSLAWSLHPSPYSSLTLQQNKEQPKDKIKISLKQAPSLIQGHVFLISTLTTFAKDILWILLDALLHHPLRSPWHHFHSQFREGNKNSLFNMPRILITGFLSLAVSDSRDGVFFTPLTLGDTAQGSVLSLTSFSCPSPPFLSVLSSVAHLVFRTVCLPAEWVLSHLRVFQQVPKRTQNFRDTEDWKMLQSIGISQKRYKQRNPGQSPSQSGVRGDAGTFSGVGI